MQNIMLKWHPGGSKAAYKGILNRSCVIRVENRVKRFKTEKKK